MEKAHYSDAVKELAYEIWAIKGSENVSKTRQLLLEGKYGDPIDVPERTLYRWAADYEWKIRKSEQIKQLAPSIREHIFGELIFTTAEAVGQIREAVQAGDPLDKALVSLTLGYLDRTGFSPVGKNDTSKVLDEVKPRLEALPEDLSQLTDAELQALEARYTGQKGRKA